MSVKQDRAAPRTATDLERKYKFGERFSEILGLIDDTRDKVDSVESGLKNTITNTETSLKRNTEEIVAKAKKEISDSVNELSSEVELKLDADGVEITVDRKLSDGVERVETKNGYVFDHEGLNISKSGEEMTNLLDHTGMYVKRDDEEILTANNNGVNAVNLHAKTYLIVGSGDGRSRFEDYGINRTACFWVGG